MLNIIHNQRNANQNHNEVLLHSYKDAYNFLKKFKENKHWKRCRETCTLTVHYWWEYKIMHFENSLTVLKCLNIFIKWPNNSTSRYSPGEMITYLPTKSCKCQHYSKPPKVQTTECLWPTVGYNVIYPCNGIPHSHKKKKNQVLIDFTRWMDLENRMPSERSHMQRSHKRPNFIYMKCPE